MRISDTRLHNFRQILAEKKLRLIDIAELLGKAPAQVSAFGGKNPTKGIGDQIAREIERALSLPNGSLDIPHGFANFDNGSVLGYTGRKLPVIGSIAAGAWCSSEDNFDRERLLHDRSFEKQSIMSSGFDTINMLPTVYLEVIDNSLLKNIDKHLNLDKNKFIEVLTNHRLFKLEV